MRRHQHQEIISVIGKEKKIVILRGIETTHLAYVGRLFLRYGIKVIEITMDSPDALKSI